MGTRPAKADRTGERDCAAVRTSRPHRAAFRRVGRGALAGALVAAATFGWPAPADAIISSDAQPDTGYPAIINTLVGADRFYDNGYFGEAAVVANVEAGLVWNGHETTSQNPIQYIYDPTTFQTVPGQLEFDAHATAVGMVLAGLGPPTVINDQAYYQYYQLGMAPGAWLWSAAVATSYGPGEEFNVSAQTIRYAYQTVCTQPVFRINGNNLIISSGADVINSSWGFTDPSGSAAYTQLIDAMMYQYHKTLVVAAGNSNTDTPPGGVGGPASGFNSISVGALADDVTQPIYSTVADFSSRGPGDFYNPQTGMTIPGVRATVDIVGPGTNLIVAAYTGATGGNTGVTDPTIVSTPPLPNNLYYVGVSGTSFAAPIVAGGATLICDAGWQNFGGGSAIDGRVVKAVLLNSADKIAGWTNGLAPNAAGVLTTTQSLDYNSGAGALDLNRAYDQYLSGTTDVPGTVITTPVTVAPLGWDYAQVTPANPNDYIINTTLHQGDTFTATLNWFVQGTFTDDSASIPLDQQNTGTDTTFFNLDLQVWEIVNGAPTLIAQSISWYNNTQQLWFQIPSDGEYFIRVYWGGTVYDLTGDAPQVEYYGLAWSDDAPVPEPASLALLGIGSLALLRRRRGRI